MDVINPAEFGGTPLPDDSGVGTDSTDALLRAIDHAKSSRSPGDPARRIHLNGWYKFNRDLRLDDSGITITGEGGNTGLLGVNAGVIIGGTGAGYTTRQALRNLRVRRATPPGTEHGIALKVEGAGMNSGNYPTRWALDHVEAESPIHPRGENPEKSEAVNMSGTFLATCTALYARNAHTGLVIERDSVKENLGANAITFLGGEIQAVNHIGRITKGLGIAFHGMAWEGARQGGMVADGVQGLTIHGAYLEANADYDIRIGEQEPCAGVSIQGGFSSVGAIIYDREKLARKRSIVLRQSHGTDIAGLTFPGYTTPPVLVDEVAPGRVTGRTGPLHTPQPSVPEVEVKAGRDWG